MSAGLFWLIAGAMTATALAWLLAPLLRPSRGASAPTRHDAVAVFHQRAAELEAEVAAGTVTPDVATQARADLERRLLEETAAEDTPPARDTGPLNGLAAALVAAVVGMVTIGGYLSLGEPRGLAPGEPVAAAGEDPVAHAQGMASMDEAVRTLAARLQARPDDVDGWKMLGRSLLVLERHAEAADALRRALDLGGEDADLLADVAEAEAFVAGNRFDATARGHIDRALALDPDHEKGLWLGGFAAFQGGDPALGLERWRRLLANQPADSSQAGLLRELIERTTSSLAASGQSDQAATGDAPTAVPGTAPAPGAGRAAGAEAITVEVALDPALAARVAGDDTVFVFARAAEGPPMPLAVARLRAADLPAVVTLDDSMAMAAGLQLSRFGAVQVVARVSRSGSPTASSGDLEGAVGGVAPGQPDPVSVRIERVVP
ncbi:MAG: c-type cytochrome biogenesis protein CcmI [Ectothiorhodospiraceae bacterium]|nr:c-type cytochrome biogenesis protein CcmI [Ectothiorhodospiraceae bacterium]